MPDKWGGGGGIKFGIPINPSVDIQIGGNFAQSESGDQKYHQWLAGADALYLFTPGGFRPFVVAGLGIAHDANQGFGVNSPYLDLGAGFQYKFTPTVGMQADVREVGIWRDKEIGDLGIKKAGNTYVNVGLTWAFGGPAGLAAVARGRAAALAPAPAPAASPASRPRRRRPRR